MSEREQQGIEKLLAGKPESIEALIDEMSAEVYEALKLAVEISKWPDDRRLEEEQRDLCMQAIILFEAKHLPEQDRIGFDLSASCKSKAQGEQVQEITVGASFGDLTNKRSKA